DYERRVSAIRETHCAMMRAPLGERHSLMISKPSEVEMSYPVVRRLFTIAEYHQMIAAEILTKNDRVELLNGEIVEMSPVSPGHASVVKRITRAFNRCVGDEVIVSVQDPIQLDDLSGPQPDVALLQARPD